MTTVADLITNRLCSPACVAAVTAADRCRCPCAGGYHGLVTDAVVTGLIEARTAGRVRMTDDEIIRTVA